MDEIKCGGRALPHSHICRSPRAERLVSYVSLAKFMRYSMVQILIVCQASDFGTKIKVNQNGGIMAFISRSGHVIQD